MLALQLRVNGIWRSVGTLRPGEPDGSISHNGRAGREIYAFTALSDRSVIRRSLGGVDVEIGPTRAIGSMEFEIVDELTPAHPDLEFWLRTDAMPEPVPFRFHHE